MSSQRASFQWRPEKAAAAALAMAPAAWLAWLAYDGGLGVRLAANLDVAYGLRPAWWVLMAGLAAAAAGWRFRLVPQRPAARMTSSNAA
jgi:hypothetical protein